MVFGLNKINEFQSWKKNDRINYDILSLGSYIVIKKIIWLSIQESSNDDLIKLSD